MKPLGLILVILCALDACSSFPPLAVSAGFLGATVGVSTPGWQKPVPVVPTPAITSPALLVPIGSPIAGNETATVTDHNTTAVVPIVEAPVDTPVLAVPKK